MNNRISLLMFATAISFLSLGCSQTYTSDSTPNNQNAAIESHKSVDLTWLNYADPKADANLAIEKQDFNLLAFAGRVTSFPGIDGGSSTLQQRCGFRLLSDSSDALRSENQLKQRKKLYQYAATYNQLVADACQKNNQGESN
jgi:hypothetical protein